MRAQTELPQEGDLIGRYRLIRRIGRGAMGEIYEVRNERLGKRFALKTISPLLLESAEAMARFRQEAELVAGIDHPNVVSVVDWERMPSGAPCMIMELLEGESLRALVEREGPLPWREIYAIGTELFSGLLAAHRVGVTHRDLKPANIFLARNSASDRTTKILDFGLARIAAGARLTGSTSSALGTPAFMAPEQALSEDVGLAADVWSAGVVLYYMATARLPFEAESVPATLFRVCSAPYTPPGQFRDCPPEFERLVDACLVKDPHARDLTAEGARDWLGRLRSNQPPATTSAAPTPPHRRRALLLGVAGLAAVALVGLGLALSGDETARASQPTTPGPAPAVHQAEQAPADPDGNTAAATELPTEDGTEGADPATEDPPADQETTAAATENPVGRSKESRRTRHRESKRPAEDGASSTATRYPGQPVDPYSE